MSAAEIIRELPKLTEQERRAVRQTLLDLANQDKGIAACNQSALEGAILLDRLEDQDARLGIGYSQAVSKTRGVSPPAAALASYRALAR